MRPFGSHVRRARRRGVIMVRSLLVRGRPAFSCRAAFCLFALTGSGSFAVAQQLPEGWSTGATALTGSTSQALLTPAGLVTYDGSQVLLSPSGQSPIPLLQTSGTVFGSFLLQVDAGRVLFGHTGIGPVGTTDRIWLLPLQGPPPLQPLAAVPFNYDAVMLTGGTVLLSARTGGFAAAANDLLVLDLVTGNIQNLALLPGASGPVALGPNGDVYYATGSAAFPTPLGTASVLRFPRAVVDAAIQNQTVLGLADAQVVMAGLDAAGDLLFDDDGDLLFVDWLNLRIGQIDAAASAQPSLGAVVANYANAPVSPTSLQWLPGNGSGVFEPFQPANGRLLVHATDYFSTAELREVFGARPGIAVAGGAVLPSGPFQVDVTSGPALGIGVVAFAMGHLPGVQVVTLPPFEQPLLLSDTMLGGPVTITVLFDAAGAAVLTGNNPGFAPALPVTLQAVFVSNQGVLGATNVLPISIAL